jgi:hypothetical protein
LLLVAVAVGTKLAVAAAVAATYPTMAAQPWQLVQAPQQLSQ